MSDADDHPDAVECEHPHCQKALLDGGQTYADEHGNELLLCPNHYYELVADEPATERRRVRTVPSGVNTGTTSLGTATRRPGQGLFGDDA